MRIQIQIDGSINIHAFCDAWQAIPQTDGSWIAKHSSIPDTDKAAANLDAKTGEKRVKIDRFQTTEFVKK